MNTYQKTLSLLKKNNLKANKRFGQNFLIDDNILAEIVSAADISEEDIIIEIGPGLGNLTEYLLEKAKKVIAFEIDKNMVKILEERFNTSKLEIVYNDILKVNIDSYIYSIIANMADFKGKVKIVANLPYYITTPIIFQIFETSKIISDITIMIQKEVAERIVAKSGSKDYGVLTVMCNYYANSEIKVIVPPTSFEPAPNVYSSVVNMKRVEKFENVDSNKFHELVKAAFSQRRKKMINSLMSSKEIGKTKDEILKIYEEVGISENARAEEVTTEQFIEIYRKMQNNDAR